MAVLLGAALAAMHLRVGAGGSYPHWALGAMHGVIGAAGLAAFAVALVSDKGPVGVFAWDAIVLLGAALITGVVIPVLAWSRQRGTELAIVLHASVAVIGYVILMAYVSVG